MIVRTLRIRADGDYLRLAAYRAVLREIAARGDMQPWEVPDNTPEPGGLAAAALRHFGDDVDSVQP